MDNEGKASLFRDVKFVIAQSRYTDEIKTLLIDGGAKHINYLSEHVTLVIADINCPEAEEAVDLYDKPVVKSIWVYLSLKANKLLPTEAFSPNETIFNNVIASFSPSLSKKDVEILVSTLTFYGARVAKNYELSTHFIVASADDCKSLPENKLSSQKIVAPDWIIDSVKQKSCCDEQLYHPDLLLPKPVTPPPPPPPSAPQPPSCEATSIPSAVTKLTTSSPPKNTPNQSNLSTPSPKSQNRTPEKKNSPIISTAQVRPLSSNQYNNNIKNNTNIAPNQARVQNPQIRPQHQNEQQFPRVQQIPPTQQQQYYQKQYVHPPNYPQQDPSVGLQQAGPSPNHSIPTGPPPQVTNARPQFRPNFVNTGPTPNQIRSPRNVFYNQHQQNKQPINIQQQSQMQMQQPQSDHMPNQQQYHSQQQPMMQQQPRPQQQQYYQRPQQNFIPAGAQNQVTHMQQTPQQPTHVVQGGPVQTMTSVQPNRVPYQTNLGGASGPPMPQRMNLRGTRPQFYNQPPKQASPSLQHSQEPLPNNQQYHMHNHIQQPHQQQQYYQRQYPQQNFQQAPQIQNQSPAAHPQHINQQSQMMQPVPGQSNQSTSLRPVYQPNMATSPSGMQPVRVARNLFYNPNQDVRPVANVRMTNPAKTPNYTNPVNQSSATRLSSVSSSGSQTQVHMQTHVNQPQPHPSIFDGKQESSLAQIKAKVPTVLEDIDYLGHDPKENVPKDQPLLGCRLKLTDYDGVDERKKQRWFESIQAAGGSIEDNLDDATHLVCENRLSTLYRQALDKGVRCVTIHWVNDVLAKNHLTFPWKALHLPLPFSNSNKPLPQDHIITVTNLRRKDRREIIDMIRIAGAKYTDSFSIHNTMIVCGDIGGDKYEHAVEWKTPIVNCQFIMDILMTENKNISVMHTSSKYQLFYPGDNLKIKSYSLVKELMKPWLKPITIVGQKPLLNGESISPKILSEPLECENSALAIAENNCSALEEVKENSIEHRKRKSNEPVRLLFTHLSSTLVEKLKLQAIDLGLGVASSPLSCTHLVVDRISRTPKFICAFSHAKYIVNYRWILESHKAKHLLDEKQFILQDKVGEEKYLFNLVYSWLKREKRGGLLFNDLIFFVTPSVISDVSNVKEMIESAGGAVSTKKIPSKMQLDQIKSDDKKFVVVSCEQDLHLCSSLEGYGVDIVGVEFVICGILRQDIDYDAHRLKTPFIHPAKKLRDR